MDTPMISAASCHEDRGQSMLATGWTLVALASLTVSARFYFRSGLRNGINWDDYFIMAALIVGLVGAVFLTKLVQAGAGKHLYCLPPGQIYPVLKWSLLAQVFNVIGIGLVKISVCFCVLRLIDRARRRLSQFLWVLIAFVAASHFVQALIFLVQCRPLSALWDPNVEGKCFSSRITYTAGYTNYGLDVVTDLICAGIPIFVIHRLQMNIRTKLAVGFLMSLGVLLVAKESKHEPGDDQLTGSRTAGCAIAKAVTLQGLFGADYTCKPNTHYKSCSHELTMRTGGIVDPGILTIVEHYFGIIIASMPSLKPLFSKVLDSAISSPNNSSKRSFQKIHSLQPGSQLPPSYTTSKRSSIGGDNVRRPPDVRHSSQLELAVGRDYELAESKEWRGPPESTLQSKFSPAYEARLGKADEVGVHTRGYQHLNAATDFSSVPAASRT
ncbi:MAG: hypothetical protein Q9174_002592 [Haloplaca sp. 1 TL-2023]